MHVMDVAESELALRLKEGYSALNMFVINSGENSQSSIVYAIQTTIELGLSPMSL